MTTLRTACLALLLSACSSGGGGFYGKVSPDMGVKVPLDAGWQVDFARPIPDGGGGCVPVGGACGAESCCAPALCQETVCVTPPTCKSSGTQCAPGDNCCMGLVCNVAERICEACGTTGKACALDGDCCGGFMCIHNVCSKPVMCKPDGQACNVNGDCCGALCNGFDKVCATCGSSVNADCASNADCCANQNWTCNVNTNHCQQPMMCKGQGVACAVTIDCCKGLYCDGAKCTSAPMCKVIGAACAAYTDCCDSNSMDCVSSKCCIEAMYQDATMIKCFADADCCNGEKCVAGSCM